MEILEISDQQLRGEDMILVDGKRSPKSGLKYNSKQGLQSSYTAMEYGEWDSIRVGIADQMIKKYKASYPKTQYKSLQGLRFLLITLIKVRKRIALTKNLHCTPKTLKKMADQLSGIYPILIEARSGVSKQVNNVVVFSSSPTIQLRIMAEQFIREHWQDHLWRHKGEELNLKTYDPDQYEYDKLKREGKI